MGRMSWIIRRSIICFLELGWAKHALAAGLFNFSLRAVSIMNAPLFWAAGQRLGSLAGRCAAVAGIAATWGCYCVGLILLGPSPLYLPYQGGRRPRCIFWSRRFFYGRGS